MPPITISAPTRKERTKQHAVREIQNSAAALHTSPSLGMRQQGVHHFPALLSELLRLAGVEHILVARRSFMQPPGPCPSTVGVVLLSAPRRLSRKPGGSCASRHPASGPFPRTPGPNPFA